MSIICSSHNLEQLEAFNRELAAHCYALHKLVRDDGANWSGPRLYLLTQRVDFLSGTCHDFFALESALRQGYDLDPEIPLSATHNTIY